jgi:8-oxo-dGTP pyrophosphatase MutT (NUDIX family)
VPPPDGYRSDCVSLGLVDVEVPAGGVDEGEPLEQAAAREVLEETGCRPGPLRRLHGYHPSNGLSDQAFVLYAANGATHVGPPADVAESSRVEWLPVDQLRTHVRAGQVTDAPSLGALLWWLLHEA